MGSKKKKSEKKKDFQKPKLKVGKSAARAANHTDTSFSARTIRVASQLVRPASADADLARQLALCRHHSAATRKEVLTHLASTLPSASSSTYKQILTSTVSLVTDPDPAVRSAFVALLVACARVRAGLIDVHMTLLVLFVHLAMLHIQPDVRASSTAALQVLADHAPLLLVQGHFVKTLRAFFTLMAWKMEEGKAAAAAVTAPATGGLPRARARHVAVLRKILEYAVYGDRLLDVAAGADAQAPHPHTSAHLVPASSQAFASLRLFSQELPAGVSDVDSVATDDEATRRRIVREVFGALLRRNLENMVHEGGEPGKEATQLLEFLRAFLLEAEADD